ncbi:MAG: hypothetical protein NC548_57780 [Lachnospiraceae bacterium]|nr:hypothetical protein [Lachnospiraceae bacterium]
MKKVTTFLAIAAVAALPALGQVSSEVKSVTAVGSVSSEAMTQVQQVQRMSKVGENTPKKVSQVSDLYGMYEYKCVNQSTGARTTLTPVIEAGLGANEIAIYNFPFSDLAVPGVVDVAAGVITISKVDSGIFNSTYGENQILGPLAWTSEGRFDPQDSIDLEIAADGSIKFPTLNGYPTGIAYYVSAGFFYAFNGYSDYNQFDPLHMTEIDLSEWKSYGQVDFQEPVLNTLIDFETGNIVPAYKCDFMVNKNNPNLYLLVNPYANDYFSQYGFNSSSEAKGYYLIDATDPECVLLEPLVESGLPYAVGKDDAGNYIYESLCVFNLEAMMIRDGYTVEDIMDDFGANDDPVSSMDDNVITLCNVRFNFPSNPLGTYNWQDEDETTIMMLEGIITLDPTGVESVEFDENAPVKYFNLQGVEVANPAKGQLVIKTQGSKAQKMIVR